MTINDRALLTKIIRMFSPHGPGTFLDFDGSDVIHGPNDRSIIGFDTNFPKAWLIEDYDFTPEEADWFVAEVKRLALEDASV
jgi:hypothetical protein